MRPERGDLIRSLFDEYIEMYASRDDRLTARFSDDFSGYTGGGDFLVKDRDEWKKITRQDFAQVTEPIRIEMLDLSMQDIADTVVVATALFHIHLPIPDHILSKEKVRLVLIFRLESENWRIVHSGISVPYWGVQEGEVYPIKGLHERNRELEAMVTARTAELEEMLGRVKRLEGLLSICMHCKKIRAENNDWHQLEQYIGEHSDAVFSHGICPECMARTTTEPSVTAEHGNGKHILYVDDEAGLVLLMKLLLTNEGFRFSGYTDPREALAAVRANPDKFDLVVTDYKMPYLSGLEVAQALKEVRPDLPVVLASGYITEEVRAKAPAAGICGLIEKPSTTEGLCEAVARFANVQSKIAS